MAMVEATIAAERASLAVFISSTLVIRITATGDRVYCDPNAYRLRSCPFLMQAIAPAKHVAGRPSMNLGAWRMAHGAIA
jgi:hypothetical protein